MEGKQHHGWSLLNANSLDAGKVQDILWKEAGSQEHQEQDHSQEVIPWQQPEQHTSCLSTLQQLSSLDQVLYHRHLSTLSHEYSTT